MPDAPPRSGVKPPARVRLEPESAANAAPRVIEFDRRPLWERLTDRPMHPEPFYRRQATWVLAAVALLGALVLYHQAGIDGVARPVLSPASDGAHSVQSGASEGEDGSPDHTSFVGAPTRRTDAADDRNGARSSRASTLETKATRRRPTPAAASADDDQAPEDGDALAPPVVDLASDLIADAVDGPPDDGGGTIEEPGGDVIDGSEPAGPPDGTETTILGVEPGIGPGGETPTTTIPPPAAPTTGQTTEPPPAAGPPTTEPTPATTEPSDDDPGEDDPGNDDPDETVPDDEPDPGDDDPDETVPDPDDDDPDDDEPGDDDSNDPPDDDEPGGGQTTGPTAGTGSNGQAEPPRGRR